MQNKCSNWRILIFYLGLLQNKKFRTSREHVAGAYSYRLRQKRYFFKSMQNSGERIVVMTGCFNGWVFSWQKFHWKLLVATWLLLAGFSAESSHCCISIILSELWKISSGTLKTKIVTVKLIFFWGERTYVTISSFLR